MLTIISWENNGLQFGFVKFFFKTFQISQNKYIPNFFAVVESLQKVKQVATTIFCKKEIINTEQLIYIKQIVNQYMLIESKKYYKLQLLTKLK
jgi:hypothetical protein